MEREELTDALRTEAEWAADHDYDIPLMLCGNLRDAVTLLESDAAEIAALKAENERIRQNSVSQEVYQMMCEERDAAVKEQRKSHTLWINDAEYRALKLALSARADSCHGCAEEELEATEKEYFDEQSKIATKLFCRIKRQKGED